MLLKHDHIIKYHLKTGTVRPLSANSSVSMLTCTLIPHAIILRTFWKYCWNFPSRPLELHHSKLANAGVAVKIPVALGSGLGLSVET